MAGGAAGGAIAGMLIANNIARPLTPPLRSLVVAIAPPKLAALRYTKERVLVVLNGVEADAAVLGAALDLCCAAANRTL